ncbi:MAG: hypothetical protein PHW15_02755 [Patescibacteria group bacterium]|nr:hypothetical protein [Patescibacteria group bacterium]
MELTRSKELENKLAELVVKNWVTKPRNIALTDVLSPRKAYFQRKFPEPPTLKEVLYFLSGKAIEKGLSELIGFEHPEARKTDGIWYNPDFRIPEPTELKSRRSNLPKEGEELEKLSNYVDQLFGYCALDDTDSGNLVVFALAEKVDDSRKTEPVLAAYKFECTNDERETYRKLLDERRIQLEQALEDEDFSKLPHCEEWKCFRTIVTMLEKPSCSCGKEFSNDYLLNKHLHSKTGNGHTGTFSVKKYEKEPVCKYYERCMGGTGTLQENVN